LVTIANSGETIFIPAVSARACMIVRKVVPGRAIGTVVFTHCPPSTLAQVRTPALPMFPTPPRFFQSLMFRCPAPGHRKFTLIFSDQPYSINSLNRGRVSGVRSPHEAILKPGCSHATTRILTARFYSGLPGAAGNVVTAKERIKRVSRGKWTSFKPHQNEYRTNAVATLAW